MLQTIYLSIRECNSVVYINKSKQVCWPCHFFLDHKPASCSKKNPNSKSKPWINNCFKAITTVKYPYYLLISGPLITTVHFKQLRYCLDVYWQNVNNSSTLFPLTKILPSTCVQGTLNGVTDTIWIIFPHCYYSIIIIIIRNFFRL